MQENYQYDCGGNRDRWFDYSLLYNSERTVQ